MRLRVAAIAVAAATTAFALTACGGSPTPSSSASTLASLASSSDTVPPAPTVQAGGGFGTWTLNDATQTSTVTFDKDGTSSAAKEAAACVNAMNAPPVIWVVVTVENKSAEILWPNGVTVVTADGAQINATSAIETLNNAYGDAPESAARAACVDTNQKLADAQIENGVYGGAKFVALQAIPATVTGIKSVTLNGYGNAGSLTYGN